MSGQYPYYAGSSSNPYASTSYSGNPYSTNPYANPNAGQAPVVPANAYEYDVGMLAQSSVYVPGAAIDKRGGAGGKVEKGGKRVTVLRKGGGRVWEDQTMLEWDSKWFRLFVGDVSNDVSDDVLAKAFSKYPSFTKAKVIRDKLSQKAKFGFVAFSDPEDFLKAWKEMDGKYVGNRPIRLKKADNANTRPVEIGHRKARQLEQARKDKRHKPY